MKFQQINYLTFDIKTFLNIEEFNSMVSFKIHHAHKNRCNIKYDINFNPIGRKVEIYCTICNKKEDITDYNAW